MLQPLHLTIRRGETVNLPIRVESDTLAYKSITAVTQSAPVRLTAAAHGLTTGWRAGIMNVKGMTDLNTPLGADGLPKDAALRRVTVIDPATVEFNAVNAAGFKPYASGGQLVYYAPVDLALYVSAAMQIKDKVGGAVLLALSTTAGSLLIDAPNAAVWVKLSAAATAALAFRAGVFDIELTDGTGNKLALCAATSTITILPEITTV